MYIESIIILVGVLVLILGIENPLHVWRSRPEQALSRPQ